GELQLPHISAARQSRNLACAGALHVAIRQTQIRVVKHVARIRTQGERDALGYLERLEYREILLDEMRTIQRVDRIASEGVGGRNQEGRADAADKPLVP